VAVVAAVAEAVALVAAEAEAVAVPAARVADNLLQMQVPPLRLRQVLRISKRRLLHLRPSRGSAVASVAQRSLRMWSRRPRRPINIASIGIRRS